MVSINEYHAKSLIDKYSKEGYIVISPCRGCSDFNIDITAPNKTQLLSQANKPLIQYMIKHIKDRGFSYTPVFGGFVENQGEDNEEVVSCAHHHEHHHHDSKLKHNFKHTLLHSIEIFIYVLIVNIIFGLLVEFLGEARLINFLHRKERYTHGTLKVYRARFLFLMIMYM